MNTKLTTIICEECSHKNFTLKLAKDRVLLMCSVCQLWVDITDDFDKGSSDISELEDWLDGFKGE